MDWKKPTKNPNGALQESENPSGYKIVFARRESGAGLFTATRHGKPFVSFWTEPKTSKSDNAHIADLMRGLCASDHDMQGMKKKSPGE